MHSEKIIGKKIGELRQKQGLSRVDFADIMAVSAQAVGKWERGESLPDIVSIKKIADFFNVKVDSFFEIADDASNILFNEAASSANHSAFNTVSETQKEQKEESDQQKAMFWNMSAANWKNADFSRLAGLADKFRGSNVANCKFCDSDLAGIVFRSNNIKNCDFSRADLSSAKLSICSMYGNDFSSCNFKNTTIKLNSIQGCTFVLADFSNAEFSGTSINKSNLNEAKLFATKFKNTFFNKVTFTGSVSDCSFVSCFFKGCKFNNVTFSNTFFKNQTIKGTEFTNCKADRLSYSFLKNCKINMEGIEFLD